MLNTLTIDIEDYFQVHAFSDIIRYEDWGNYECRIERNVDRILEILNGGHQNSKFNNNSITHSLNNSFTQKGNDSSGLSPCAMPSAPCKLPKATFFILGWIAERYPDLVRRIQKEGHEIASHVMHISLFTNNQKKNSEKISERLRPSSKTSQGIK